MNHALHIAAITQIRRDTPGRVLYRRKLAEGKSHKEALRCLKRRISDAVWRQLQTDRSDDQTQNNDWPRWPSSRGNLVAYRSPDTPCERPAQARQTRHGPTSTTGFGAWPHRSISIG